MDGKENPPIYLGIDDDIIEFEKLADNIEQFLLTMILEATEYNMDSYTEKEEIASVLSDATIDITKLEVHGQISACLDIKPFIFLCQTPTTILILYYVKAKKILSTKS